MPMLRIPRVDRVTLALIVAASFLLQLPFLDLGLSTLDEGSLLAIADSLASGEVLYRDRATFISPLAYECMARLLEIFGAHLWVGRVFQAGVFSGVVALVYAILRAFAPPRWSAVAALSLLALKPLAFPLWTIPNYNPLALLFALGAVAATLAWQRRPGSARLALAGGLIGLAVVTKLSLGAAAALSCAACVALDVGLRRGAAPLALLRPLALLAGVACLPGVALGLHYARLGALGDLVDRTLLALGSVSQEMRVPLPSPLPWSGSGEELFRLRFLYWPSPVFAWLGEDTKRTALAALLDAGVKLAYYGPLAAIAGGGVVAARAWRARRREPAGGWLLITLFAAASYAHTAHRLDLAHVLGIAPAPLIVCAALLQRGPRRRRVAAPALLALWLGAGAFAGIAVAKLERQPLDTPRGRLRVAPDEAADARALLDFLAERPAGERILLLRTLPLYYFLSGRAIPGPFDLFLPAYLRPGEDERFALGLGDLERVIQDPNDLPGIPAPITEYAPRSARALADRFEIERQLSPTALVWEPRAGGPERRPVVAEIARGPERVRTGARPGRVERTSWLVYPVVTSRLLRGDQAVCLEFPHRSHVGEVLSVRPMFAHLAWTRRHWPDAARRVIASVHARTQQGERPLWRRELRAGPPGPALELPLDDFAGQSLTLRFCAQRADGPDARGVASFGWADPRILGSAP